MVGESLQRFRTQCWSNRYIDWINAKPINFFYAEDEFKNIANLLVGSFYVSSTNQSFDKLKLIRDYNNDTINRIGELYESIILPPHVTWHFTVGSSGTNLNATPADLVLNPKFIDIKDKPLGSIPNIIFWNQDQLKALNKLDTQSHIVIWVFLKASHILFKLNP